MAETARWASPPGDSHDVCRTGRSAGFYNAGGLGAALIANVPPLLWFLAVGVTLVRRS